MFLEVQIYFDLRTQCEKNTQTEELALFLKSPACDQFPPAFYSHPKDSTTKQPLPQLNGSGHVILTLGRRVIYG